MIYDNYLFYWFIIGDVKMNSMDMLATKVVKCPIINPTDTKLCLLKDEWDNVQHYLQTGEDREKCHSFYPHDMEFNNGAKNIGQRTLEYISEIGAIGSLPITTPASAEVGECLA